MTTNLRLPFDGPAAPDPMERDGAARRAAVDPTRNVVLEASAGTGKTRVLVDRYVNLLESGVEPANILAITFTRKAAAEMRERIVQRLRYDATLSPGHAARWRALRERLGEVAISTIDAFCLLLLREFPLEADVDPGFTVADETDVLRATDSALDRTLPIARRLASTDADVALVLAGLDERRLRVGLASLVGRRLVVRRTLARGLTRVPAGLTPDTACRSAADRLRASFNRAEGGLAGFVAGGPRAHPRFALLAHDLAALDSPGAPESDSLDPASLEATIELLRAYFLTAAGKPRERLASAYGRNRFQSPEAARKHAREVARLAPEIAETIARFRRDLNAIVTRGLARIFRIACRLYVQQLEATGVLDFTELLRRALGLLGRMDEFSQSRYRLESRYHHLLVDEFQDTSSPQWRLISRLVKSWGEGSGLPHDSPLAPSIFIVGDRKQSIYGFRDADVTILGRARRAIEALRPEGPVRRTISKSFRAVPALQTFLNDLFGAIDIVTERRDRFRFGSRDRFPLAAALSAPESDGAGHLPAAGAVVAGDDAIPLGLVAGDDLRVVARAVADEIAHLLAGATVRDRASGLPRAVRPGDIGILFRSRESHREYARALEDRAIPSYVYKGLGFFDADEVKDVVALVRYLAEPASELRAAAFLRSRFVGLSDPALQALTGRLAARLAGSSDLPASLSDDDREVLETARASVRSWLHLADRLPPSGLLDRVLAESAYAWELRGPRLAQARENLKKVRALVRRIQNRGYATLDRISRHLEQLSAGDESNAIVDAVDAVNLMTIHAAKGLEFPIVFLVNLTKGSGGRRAPIRVAAATGQAGTGAPDPSLVSVGDFTSDADEDLRAREREETKRLLYVAATRARDRLYFSAVLKDGEVRPGTGSLAQVLPPSFCRLLAAAQPHSGARIVRWVTPTGPPHLLRVLPVGSPSVPSSDERARCPASTVIDAFERPVGIQEAERVTVTGQLSGVVVPGSADEAPGAAPPSGESSSPDRPRAGDDDERMVGILVHRLLQAGGPGAAEDAGSLERRARAMMAHDWGLGSVSDQLVRRALGIYQELHARPELRRLLAEADLLFELPFSLVDEGRILRGTIDCVARRRDGGVTVVEVKTGAPRPEHQAQLALYLRAAAWLFPGAPTEGLLVYGCDPPERERNRPDGPGV